MKMTPYLKIFFGEDYNDEDTATIYYIMSINNDFCVSRFYPRTGKEIYYKFKQYVNGTEPYSADKALFDFIFCNEENEGEIALCYNGVHVEQSVFDKNPKKNDQTRQAFYQQLNILKHLQMGELYTNLDQEIKNLYFQFSDSKNAGL